MHRKYLARAFEIVSLYSPRFESIFPHTQSRYSLPIEERCMELKLSIVEKREIRLN